MDQLLSPGKLLLGYSTVSEWLESPGNRPTSPEDSTERCIPSNVTVHGEMLLRNKVGTE